MMLLWSVITMVICKAVTAVSAASDQSVVVTTPYGSLRGVRTPVGSDSSVNNFYGIPYAKPPVGDLRFQNPQVNEAWSGTRDAASPGPVCPQVLVSGTNVTHLGTEDCLYLNVHTPQVPDGSRPLPVMVFIHGGAFYSGAANYYLGTELASHGVVVVAINYRLGALGFLSTLDSASVGNYGLQDQILALRWVRDVISSFNGDPQDVTIFGESAGGASVSLLVMSSGASGLFTKAIMESGVSVSPWTVGRASTQPQPRQLVLSLASSLGCGEGHSTAQLVACLRTKSVVDIVQVSLQLEISYGRVPTFRPVVEASFGQSGLFSADPEVILSSGGFNNVTVIRGFNKDELSYGQDNLDPEEDGFTMAEFLNLTKGFMGGTVHPRYPELDMDRAVDRVVTTYVTGPGVTDPEQLLDAYVQLMSDYYIVASTFKEVEMAEEAHSTTQYVYRFSYRSANRVTHPWQGVSHGDELNYIFGYPLTLGGLIPHFVTSWTEDDRHMMQLMMTWWTNFAKYGNPTPAGSVGTKWLPWSQSTRRYLDLDISPAMVNAPETPAIRLWNDVIPNMAEQASEGIIG